MWNKRLFVVLLSALFLSVLGLGAEEGKSYYALNRQNGLSSNCVLQMLQLRDGRMVVVTDKAVDVYDGQRFLSVAIDTTLYTAVPAYNGATHLFADRQDRLWMKQCGRLYCLDLRTMSWQREEKWTASDFFITDNGSAWLLHGRELRDTVSGRALPLPSAVGDLQDLVSAADSTYAFFSTGQMAVYGPAGQMAYLSSAYGEPERERYAVTSLVVRGSDGCFYQVRTGSGGSILLSFNPRTHRWQQMLTSDTWMHTLTPTPTGMLYLTTPEGYLSINTATGEQRAFSELHLPDGSTLTTGINTVWLDREGGIWLGTYDSGLLYTSPLSGLFDTRPIDIDVYPILTAIYLHGQPLQVGHEYDGHALLTVAPPYVEQLTFSHDQNSLAFQFSTMNYVRPRSTCYRYRFSGDRGAVAPPSTMAIPLSFGVSFSPTSMLLQGNKIIENARGSLWAGSRTSWQTAWQRNWGMKNLYAPTRGQCSAWRFPADGRHA